MINIGQYPYYSYEQAVEPLLKPIKSKAPLHFLNFQRKFPNFERLYIILNKAHSVEWCDAGFYKYSIFEHKFIEEKSAYYMWDHSPQTFHSSRIRDFNATRHSLAHGLTIVRKHPEHIDYFAFAARPGQNQIHHFYLNEKELLERFVDDFYRTMATTIEDLYDHKIYIPGHPLSTVESLKTLTPRQQDCLDLLSSGLTTKQIGCVLGVSHRTIEGHINILKHKFDAKNRPHLLHILSSHGL